VDVVVNNAGIVRDAQLVKINGTGTVKSMPEESWDSVIDVNLKGVFITTRAVVPHMMRQGGGVILNAASVVALNGNFGQTNYVASKAGVIGMTRTWARELGKHNIRVNAVAPGFIATDMLKSMPPDILDNMIDHTPMRRVGKPEDVANAYFWLASDQASFVHGAVLSVDGGMVIGT
jgi:3-oxoacyl-[acyl-carrier protein] reductase